MAAEPEAPSVPSVMMRGPAEGEDVSVLLPETVPSSSADAAGQPAAGPSSSSSSSRGRRGRSRTSLAAATLLRSLSQNAPAAGAGALNSTDLSASQIDELQAYALQIEEIASFISRHPVRNLTTEQRDQLRTMRAALESLRGSPHVQTFLEEASRAEQARRQRRRQRRAQQQEDPFAELLARSPPWFQTLWHGVKHALMFLLRCDSVIMLSGDRKYFCLI
eukprot:tig00000792_g4155.t1